jgi:hypothetical protein
MKSAVSLADHLAPDTVNRLERAAEIRHDDALILMRARGHICALYLFGHSAEMCLAAAYFRATGFSPMMVIDRDTRLRAMKQARQLLTDAGEPLMSSDPHPVVGWVRFLRWKRSATKLSPQEQQRLEAAIFKAEMVYKHWRPELRYKTTHVQAEQLAEVLKASTWILEQRGRL